MDLFFRIVLLIVLCFFSMAISTPTKKKSANYSWSDAIIDYQKAYRKHHKSLKFQSFKSPIFTYRDQALQIKIDVSGMEYIKLVVDGTIDGNRKDHAAWGNARFIDAKGIALSADKVPVWNQSQGYSTLTFDENMMGNEIVIGSIPYEKGITMHAEGFAIFKLDRRFKTFEAEVGVEQKGGDRNSSVIFKVEDAKSELLYHKLESDFPVETKLFKKYAGKSAASLLSEKSPRVIMYVANHISREFDMVNLVEKEGNIKGQIAAMGKMLYLSETLGKLRSINPQSVLDAYQHLSSRYGEKYFKHLGSERENVSSFLNEYAFLIDQLKHGETDATIKSEEMIFLARKINLSNPLIRDKSILVVRHELKSNARTVMANGLGYPGNNWTTSASIQFPGLGWNNDIAVLEDVLDPKIRRIYKPEKPVVINDPDLHWDGKRILFSSIGDNNRWAIFQVNVDGSGLKKVTPDGFDDLDFFDGCYLPNGKIAMVSTAPYQGVPCVGGGSQTGSIYLLDPESKQIRQLNFGQDNDWNPVVLNNGRIMYLRWEYTDAAHYFTRILMSMNPDGTGKKEYYGSGSYWPNSLFEARPVPGNSSKFSGIVSGHHGIARSGRLVLFDPKIGRHEADGVIQEIPFRDRKVEPIIKDRLVDDVWPQFLSAYPLDENFYLANAKPGPDDLWGLYLVDTFDNMTLISEIEGEALMYPRVLEERQAPPVIPDKIHINDSTSTVYIANIYEGPGLQGVPKGSVEKLRLFAYHFTYNKSGGHDELGIQTAWDVKRVLGTVPVEEDGSAIFKIPANTPVSLQPLDEHGRAMQLMRSWFTGMPGEVVSCVGCHENQNTLPPVRPTIASRKLPDNINPFYGPARPFTFANEVQPLLDRKCTACHDGSNQLPDFSDKIESGYKSLSGAYKALHPYVRRPGPESDVHVLLPMEYHAGTSELIQKLEKGHHGVSLTREDWDRLHTWIDLNVPYHGQFQAKEFCNLDQKIRRQELANKFGGNPIDIDKELAIAAYLRSLKDTIPIKPERLFEPTKNKPSEVEWTFSAQDAKSKQSALGGHHKMIDIGNGVQLALVKIPAGEYVKKYDQSIVKIEKPFWLGQFEISNEQYNTYFPDHDSRYVDQFWKDHTSRGYPINRPDQPVVRISWEESMLFCEKLFKTTGLKFSLPSADQWEWACRAGSSTPLWFGTEDADFSAYENLADASLSDFAVIGVNPKPMSKNDQRFPYYNFIPQAPYNDGEMIVSRVGKYKPNPWGIYDMHGNVSEWVLCDYKIFEENDMMKDGDKKQVRGGSWRDRPYRSTASSSLGYFPWQKVMNVGFRVVLEEE